MTVLKQSPQSVMYKLIRESLRFFQRRLCSTYIRIKFSKKKRPYSKHHIFTQNMMTSIPMARILNCHKQM